MATAMQDTSTDIRCKIDTAQLRAMIQATAPFAAKRDDHRKSLTCVQVSIDGDTLRMVATDGYRLSETTTEVLRLSEDSGHIWLIDAAELAAAGKALVKHSITTDITAGENGLFVGGEYVFHQHTLTYPTKYIGTTRTVTRAQTNGYRFNMEGKGENFWSPYPPAREFSAEGDSYRFGTGGKFWSMSIQQ